MTTPANSAGAVVVFDLETQRSAAEVGGWANIEAMQLSVACTWDEQAGYRTWWEAQAGDLLAELARAALIVGFNVTAFDYRVLSLYGATVGLFPKTHDIHVEIFSQTHRRVGLGLLARLNLGEAKALESGLDAVASWQAGDLETLAAYCQQDVELTRRLYDFWRSAGVLFVTPADFAVWPRAWGR